jgi:hypothetical protein
LFCFLHLLLFIFSAGQLLLLCLLSVSYFLFYNKEGKKIVAENAAQLIADYTRGEVQKNLALGQLEVAKINNETDKVVAELDASTATVTELPHFKVDKICAEKCGRPDWAGKEILAVNVARMFVEVRIFFFLGLFVLC